MNWTVFILYKKMLNLVLNDAEVNVLNVYEMCMHVSQFSGSQLRCAETKNAQVLILYMFHFRSQFSS
jgi:hypothetical protein